MTPIGSIAVLLVTAGLLAGAAAGIPSLKADFKLQWFTPDDSPYQDTYKVQEKYFRNTGGGQPIYVYTKSGNYAAAHSDGSMSALYKRVGDCSWIDRDTGSWYSAFTADAGRSSRSKANEAAFATELKAFVNTPAGSRFVQDVVFTLDDKGAATGMSATKALFISKASKSGGDDIKMTKAIRECTADKPLDAFAFTRGFLYYDGLAVVDKETIQNILIACACVFVVNLVMLADVVAAVLVLLMVGLCDICILGYMSHWELDFNSVTAINLVLAVGLAVDYSAHIAHSFLVASGPGLERAKEAVDHIGKDVFNGGFSTLLAVLPLSMSKSYVFRVFFKMWFMIIVFGLFFGVILLPILLRVLSQCIGAPGNSSENAEEGEAAKANIEDPQVMGKEAGA